MKSNRIVKTKLMPPDVKPDSVYRAGVITRIDHGLENRVTLVSAPAGYGKTTLAAQWLIGKSRLQAWLSLDEGDNDPNLFLRYVVAAINTAVPDFGKEIKKLLTSGQQPPAQYLADALLNELQTLNEPLLFIFDDFYKITNREIHELTIRVLQLKPSTIHMAFLTRYDPPWPLLRWRASGWLNELRASDLRFSHEETMIFFKDYNIHPETVNLLLKQAEGWIVALQLMKLTLDHNNDPDKLIRLPMDQYRLVHEYLMEEILAHQSQELLDFLAVTAMFDRFCIPLCDFILTDTPAGFSHSSKYIDKLKKENLFLVPLDREHFWFRYHHLFRDLLNRHLESHLTSKQKSQLYSRAGKWFSENELISEAVHYLVAAGELEAASTLIAGELHTFIDQYIDLRLFDKWLSMFPEDFVENNVSLLVLQAWRFRYLYNFTEALSYSGKAKEMLLQNNGSISEPMKQNLLGDIETIQGFCRFWMGDVAAALKHTERAHELVSKVHQTAYGQAIVYQAGSLTLLGRREEALNFLASALSDDHAAGSHNSGILLLGQAVIYLYAGELEAAAISSSQFSKIAESIKAIDYWTGPHRYILGIIAYERNLLEEAEEHLLFVKKLRYRMDPRVYHDTLLVLALIYLAKGEAEKVDEYVTMARTFATEVKSPSSLAFSNAFELRLSGSHGNTPIYPEMYEATLDFNQYWIEPLSLIRAEYLIHNGKHEDYVAALKILDQSIYHARRYYNERQLIEFLSVKAVAQKCSGSLNDALETLEEALTIAEPHGFVRTLLDRGPIMAELLYRLAERYPDNAYTSGLLAAFERESPNRWRRSEPNKYFAFFQAGQPDAIVSNESELSNRELDILTLLTERLSNQEIADRLNISSHTVKKHAVNIYRKLGVTKRNQAVAIARKRGLLAEL